MPDPETGRTVDGREGEAAPLPLPPDLDLPLFAYGSFKPGE